MPHVEELFGHPLRASRELSKIVRQARCPHRADACNGGGNRDMARWPANEQPLAPLFDDRVSIDSNGFIPCGVCSVRIGGRARHDQSFAWAICPHRLLTFSARGFSDTQRALGRRVLNLAGFETGDKVNVWSEVTLRDDSVNINYRLDYVLRRADCDDPPIIVEVMTASTSGGNRSKRTDIKSAFCNAVLHANRLVPDIPVSPGVNVRQVWARMASQLIVKSEIANAWGGRTIWVVQDTLIDYIRRNTGLPLDQLRRSDWKPHEVNVVTGNIENSSDVRLYAGPIRRPGTGPCWMELLSTPGVPPVDVLLDKMTSRNRAITITV